MAVQLEHWYQWKARCAVLRCDKGVQAELSAKLLSMSRKLYWLGRQPETFSAKDIAGIFDTYNLRFKRGQTVLCKEWMLEAVDTEAPPEEKLNLCSSRAKGVLKNALGHFFRGECNHYKTRKALVTTSLDEGVVASDGREIPRADFLIQKSEAFLNRREDEVALPGTQPASAADAAEYQREAEELCGEVWRDADERTRNILLAMALGVAMTDEGLLEHLNLSASTTYETRTRHAKALLERISKKFPEDDREQHFLLAGMVQRYLHEKALDQTPLPPWCGAYMDRNGDHSESVEGEKS